MNGDRRRIDERARHDKIASTPWGKLVYAPDGRRSAYLVWHYVRGGWRACTWHRWIPRTHNPVRPAGMFDR